MYDKNTSGNTAGIESPGDKEKIVKKVYCKENCKELHVRLSERMTEEFKEVEKITEMKSSEIIRMGVRMVIEKYLKE